MLNPAKEAAMSVGAAEVMNFVQPATCLYSQATEASLEVTRAHVLHAWQHADSLHAISYLF